MKTCDVIEGLIILSKYTSSTYNVGAEHEAIYFFGTEEDVSLVDRDRLKILGWHTEEKEYNKENTWRY